MFQTHSRCTTLEIDTATREISLRSLHPTWSTMRREDWRCTLFRRWSPLPMKAIMTPEIDELVFCNPPHRPQAIVLLLQRRSAGFSWPKTLFLDVVLPITAIYITELDVTLKARHSNPIKTDGGRSSRFDLRREHVALSRFFRPIPTVAPFRSQIELVGRKSSKRRTTEHNCAAIVTGSSRRPQRSRLRYHSDTDDWLFRAIVHLIHTAAKPKVYERRLSPLLLSPAQGVGNSGDQRCEARGHGPDPCCCITPYICTKRIVRKIA